MVTDFSEARQQLLMDHSQQPSDGSGEAVVREGTEVPRNFPPLRGRVELIRQCDDGRNRRGRALRAVSTASRDSGDEARA